MLPLPKNLTKIVEEIEEIIQQQKIKPHFAVLHSQTVGVQELHKVSMYTLPSLQDLCDTWLGHPPAYVQESRIVTVDGTAMQIQFCASLREWRTGYFSIPKIGASITSSAAFQIYHQPERLIYSTPSWTLDDINVLCKQLYPSAQELLTIYFKPALERMQGGSDIRELQYSLNTADARADIRAFFTWLLYTQKYLMTGDARFNLSVADQHILNMIDISTNLTDYIKDWLLIIKSQETSNTLHSINVEQNARLDILRQYITTHLSNLSITTSL